MQVVIEIDEEEYEKNKTARCDYHTLRMAIIYGIPLPKGHGRLIDADAMFKDICNSIESMTDIGIAVDGQYLWEKLNDALFNAPTIIEADKEEKA